MAFFKVTFPLYGLMVHSIVMLMKFIQSRLICLTLILALVCPPGAYAQTVISTPTTTTQVIGAGETLTITSTGEIVVTGAAVSAVSTNGVSVNSLTNNGLLSSSSPADSTTVAIGIGGAAIFTGSILNSGTIRNVSAGDALHINNITLTKQLLNTGMITTLTGRAVRITGSSGLVAGAGEAGFRNAGTISSRDSDGVVIDG